jgi:hypothetical protein
MRRIGPLLGMTPREAYNAAVKGDVPGLKKIAGRYVLVPALFVQGMAAPSKPVRRADAQPVAA